MEETFEQFVNDVHRRYKEEHLLMVEGVREIREHPKAGSITEKGAEILVEYGWDGNPKMNRKPSVRRPERRFRVEDIPEEWR